MPSPFTRRRFIKIAAAQTAAILSGSLLRASPQTGQLVSWRGILLGADASIHLSHSSPETASRLLKTCVSEIQRLESIFSLYDSHSSLARLNKNGYIEKPPIELVEILSLSKDYGKKTEGLFDVTIHPVVEALRTRAAAAQLKAAQGLVDYRQIRISKSRIELAKTGAAITLNGIAQGYITDAISTLLQNEGISNTLVELGEKRALGNHPENRPWRIGLADPTKPTQVAEIIELSNKALSSSGGYGTPFNASGDIHHLVDPRSGQSVNHFAAVHVTADLATEADALSTTFSVCEPPQIDRIKSKFPNVGLRTIPANFG